jgi:hypothetical protein
MKFAQLTLGGRARLAVPLALGDMTVLVDVKVLSMAEEAEIATYAASFAKARGSATLNTDDPLYTYGRALKTVALSTLDHDSPVDAPVPFFSGVEEIMASGIVTVQHVMLLAEHQARWQEENSPGGQDLSFADLLERIEKIAEGDPDPFVSLAQHTRWQLVRIMARLLLDARASKSQPGSSPPENGGASAPEAAPEVPATMGPEGAAP